MTSVNTTVAAWKVQKKEIGSAKSEDETHPALCVFVDMLSDTLYAWGCQCIANMIPADPRGFVTICADI